MSVRLEHWVDAAIGETREALVRDGRVIALRVLRAHDEGRRARWGEIYAARVISVDKRRRGAFLDLGLKEDQGFAPFDQDGRVRVGRARVALKEGEGVVVSVAREAARAKNPVMEVRADPFPGAIGRLARPERDESLEAAKPDLTARARIDEAIEEALSRTAPIPGGGALTIEPTAALAAIDVDAGARAGTGDPERFALDLNRAAALEAAHQIRLRGLGGVIAIDFVSMRRQQSRQALEAALKSALADDPWQVRFAPLSRFGVVELARAQLERPLHEVLNDRDGAPSVETTALALLRAIEREGRAMTGRRIAAQAAPAIVQWLETAPLDWRGALTERIGPRFTLEPALAFPRTRTDVRAL